MTQFDAIIIGAGIHGAGFSYIAQALGLNCLLIEKSAQVGAATSSNSSKLIHGGLRYLESGQFNLVRECLQERARLLKAAPDLVTLKPFYIPVYASSRRGNTTIAMGLGLYQLFGGGSFHYLKRQQRAQYPLTHAHLNGLWQYWDCQTDDSALTQRVVRAAQNIGCSLRLNTHALSLDMPRANEYSLRLNDGTQVHSRCVINAAGPWVNEVAALNPLLPQSSIQWVQGSHLVINRPAFDGCIYLESPLDGRPFFILPWQGQQLIGTTETLIHNPNTAAITSAEHDYLISSYNHYVSSAKLRPQDVVRTFCGVRVLPIQTADPTHINRAKRDTHLVQHSRSPGYVALYGGKLTSFYATALKGLRLLEPWLTRPSQGLNFTAAAITQPMF